MAFTRQRRSTYGNPGNYGNAAPVQGNNALNPQGQQWNGQQGNRQAPNPNPQAAQPSQQPAGFGARTQAPAPQSRPNPQYREPTRQSNGQPEQRQAHAANGQSGQGYGQQASGQAAQGQRQAVNGRPNQGPHQQHPSQGQPQYQQPQQRQAQGQQAPQAQRQNANPAHAQGRGMQAPEPENTSFVSTKIWKVNGKDKVVDFSSKLTQAYEKDFANVHGIGGSDHAPNSTICVTICDFTKGKGDKSITVKYAVDVEDMAVLYHTAMAARMGLLRILPKLDMGSNSNCVFAYSKQKNNPYSTTKMNGIVYAPVSQIGIYYDPSRNYPWTIQITNCEAPIKQKANGANTHNSSQAINVQEAFISLSADDFCAAMVAVERFIRLWEQRMFRTLDAGCRKYEQAIEEMKNQKSYAS